MEHIISLIIGILLGAAITFIAGVVAYMLVSASQETNKFTLFQEIADRLELEDAEAQKTNPKPTKAKNGRRKPTDKRRNPKDGK